MTVEYAEAMNTLSTMFGSVDKEVIDAVLRSNSWHMERTIDALLSMSVTTGSTPATTTSPSQDDPVIPPEEPPFVDPEQLKQDEILARELQNELFLSEDRTRTHQNHNDVMDTDEVDDSLREVKEKFNQIGEAAKHKFREFSTMFFKDSKKDSKPDGELPSPRNGQSTSPPKKASSPLEFTSSDLAENDDDDEEIVAFDARNVRRRHVIMSDDDEDSPQLVDKRLQRNRLQQLANDDVGKVLL